MPLSIRCIPVAWLLMALSGFGQAQSDWNQDDPVDQYGSFSFSVIRIPVWVTDRNGLPKADFTRQDFQLLVDNKPATIESCIQTNDRPLELVYLLDLSGSMGMGGKVEGSAETMDWLMTQHLPGDRWRLIVFSDGQILEAANYEHPNSWQEVRPKLRGYGKTALFDTLAIADRFFEPESLNNRAILLFTDGNDNQSALDEEQLLKVLKVLEVPVFVVAIGDGFIPLKVENREKLGLQTLDNIATITGGSMFIAENAEHLPVIGRRLRTRLRPQYLLTMTVERGSNDDKHDIAVRLRGRKHYSLRYRRGYLGSLPEK